MSQDQPITLTDQQRKALEIVQKHGPIRPREFSRLMWPDSEGWSTHTNCGHGVTRGGGMNLAGGGYLGKLARKKLVRRVWNAYDSRLCDGYVLTRAGEETLKG